MSYYAIMTDSSYLAHHGIKGQKWGVRRYQNPDGSLTAAGYRHYYGHSGEMSREEQREFKSAMKADRNAWKKSAKENYKSAKEKLKSGEWAEDSKEFENAKRDRYMSKHGSKEGIDKYRYGTKEEKNAAIEQAAKRKKGKIATEVAVAAVATAAVATTAVAGVAIADAIAKIGLTTLATGGGLAAGAAGVTTATYNKSATSKGLGKNTIRMLDKQYNQVTNADGSETHMGTGTNRTIRVNMTHLKRDAKGNIIDPESQKRDLYKALDAEINRSAADKVAQKEGGITNVWNYEEIKNAHNKRAVGIIDQLMEIGDSKDSIDNYINQKSADAYKVYDWDHNVDFEYDKYHRRTY